MDAVNEPPELRLPAAAAELWAMVRDVVDDGLASLGKEPARYRIGGGTILAARWQHRESFDIGSHRGSRDHAGETAGRPGRPVTVRDAAEGPGRNARVPPRPKALAGRIRRRQARPGPVGPRTGNRRRRRRADHPGQGRDRPVNCADPARQARARRHAAAAGRLRRNQGRKQGADGARERGERDLREERRSSSRWTGTGTAPTSPGTRRTSCSAYPSTSASTQRSWET